MDAASTWASCGAMHLTGDADGPPLDVPWPVASDVARLAAPFGLDARVLAERAAVLGFGRRGRTSCGGATRLLRTRDGWMALCLARDQDLGLLPAMLGIEPSTRDAAWPAIAAAVRDRDGREVQEAGELLGVAFSVVGGDAGPFTATKSGPDGTATDVGGRAAPLVLDLSALWAGPLCTHLLRRSGARVVKVEDPARADGARAGPLEFFDLLNAGKASVALDFQSSRELDLLRVLVVAADVVVTSSRARVFDHLGLIVDDVLATKSDKVWTAITAYGWSSNRIGFGDDAAAGAGLVAWHPSDREPRFAGDAVADPMCGLRAARATLECLERGGRWFVDASLAGAAAVSGAALEPARPAVPADVDADAWSIDGALVRAPDRRMPCGRAPALGADTAAILAALT